MPAMVDFVQEWTEKLLADIRSEVRRLYKIALYSQSFRRRRDALRELVQRLYQAEANAKFDNLTQLANKSGLRALYQRLVRELTTPNHRCNPLTAALFILVDIENFAAVNAALKHVGGDKLLTEVAELLTSVVRWGDVVGRWGGDEFMLIIPLREEDLRTGGQDLSLDEFAREIIGRLVAACETYSASDTALAQIKLHVNYVVVTREEFTRAEGCPTFEEVCERCDPKHH